ncbi:MAG: LuxR C-terminal-related transcriptional regulator [Chloroflexota bacterium]
MRLFEEVRDAWGAALAIGAADIFPLIREGDPTGWGQARLEEGLARSRELDDDWLIAQRLNFLGDLARSQGDNASATARYEESLDLLRGQGLTGTVPSLLHNLGYLALRRGDARRALRLFRESLMLFRDQGDQRGIADCLDGLAGVLAAMKHPQAPATRFQAAARLLGASEALRKAIGATVWPANAADYERTLSVVRGRLDQSAFAAEWSAGRALPLERAIEEALATDSPGEPFADEAGLELTPREREVAALVAQGLTNRQIGAALFITEGTARLHVKHILQKLGFTSRAQVAGWMVAQGLAAAPLGQSRER